MVWMRDQPNRSPSAGLRRAAIVLGVIALTLGSVVSAWAHDTWLISATNFGRVGTPFRLGLTSGEKFPNDDFSIVSNRVARAIVREAGVTRSLPRPTAAALPTRIHVDSALGRSCHGGNRASAHDARARAAPDR